MPLKWFKWKSDNKELILQQTTLLNLIIWTLRLKRRVVLEKGSIEELTKEMMKSMDFQLEMTSRKTHRKTMSAVGKKVRLSSRKRRKMMYNSQGATLSVDALAASSRVKKEASVLKADVFQKVSLLTVRTTRSTISSL